MKDLMNDYKEGRFTLRELVVYGFLAPLALIATCLLVGYLETRFF